MEILYRLEQYTLQHPQEVLVLQVQYLGETDEILVFKGVSSSLQRSTPEDPDVPLLPAEANILTIDRLQSPYRPTNPHYLAQNLTWDEFQLATNI